MKATAIAPSNIAFIKYWGRKQEELRLPENGSISMNLSNLVTTTTVECNPTFRKDTITINSRKDPDEIRPVLQQLNRIRLLAKSNLKVKVVSKNNFPIGTGLSSSASGFAALTLATCESMGLHLSEKELSILARLGSGSACRSIPDGFVEWVDADTSNTSFARSLYKPTYWDLVNVVAIVSQEKKDVPSSLGQLRAKSSKFFPVRKAHMKEKITQIKTYLAQKDFQKFGELVEAEALEMHAIMLTSIPALVYLTPQSLRVMTCVMKWREQGVPVYFTLNTGQDVHCLCEKKSEKRVVELLGTIKEVKQIIANDPSVGARITSAHLF